MVSSTTTRYRSSPVTTQAWRYVDVSSALS